MVKGIASTVPKALPVGARLTCSDNSGARIVQIIGALRVTGRRGRVPTAGIGDIIIVAVKKGTPKMKKSVERAVIIRQKRAIRRPSGLRVVFEDNACALVDEAGIPKGTEIKGVIAREAAERFPKISAIAWSVI